MEVKRKTRNKGFTLPDLGFGYHDLEPFLDAETMELHHLKHHATYLINFNLAIENTALKHQTPAAIFANISNYNHEIRNNGGGFFNHSMFWQILIPGGIKLSGGELYKTIERDFESIEKLKQEFSLAANTHFGSGWVWLVRKKNNKLAITTTKNQNNPLMDIAVIQGIPILCLDLWEHAYYLNYQNRKADYICAFWDVVNWQKVEELFLRKEF